MELEANVSDINENFGERSVQSILLDVSNRLEILKVEKNHKDLTALPKSEVEKKLQTIYDIAKSQSDAGERKLALKMELETKLFEFRKLLTEAKNMKSDDHNSQNKTITAHRLIDKMNFMRKCTLIFLASDVPDDETNCHFKLNLSRTLVNDRTLNEYIKTKKKSEKEVKK